MSKTGVAKRTDSKRPVPLSGRARVREQTCTDLPPMPITTVTIASPAIITAVSVSGIVPRSVIRIPIAVGRSGVAIYGSGVAVGSRCSIIPIPWATIIPISWAADDSTNNRCTGAYNSCRCPYTCPYNRPRTVPPTTVTTPPTMTP